MATSRTRTRVEIDAQLHAQIKQLATREGYPVSRFLDKLLYIAVEDYIMARQAGYYPFAGSRPTASGVRSELPSDHT